MTKPLLHHENATIWYESHDEDDLQRIEGETEIYPNWVRVDAQWLPRDKIDLIVT